MNSLTVNLHLMMASFYRPTRERHRILLEEHAFPSDDYALESQAIFHGFDPAEALVRLRPGEGKHTIDTEDVARVLERDGESIALVLLPGVQYYTGQAFDDRGDHATRARRRGASSASTWRTRRETWSCASTSGTWTSPSGARTST